LEEDLDGAIRSGNKNYPNTMRSFLWKKLQDGIIEGNKEVLASLDVAPWRQLFCLRSSGPLWCSILWSCHGCWFFLSQLLFILFHHSYHYYHLLYVLFLAKIKHFYPLGFIISILIVRYYHTVGFFLYMISPITVVMSSPFHLLSFDSLKNIHCRSVSVLKKNRSQYWNVKF
jgi:hypothetical protein